jgi:hypothetical protein
MSELHFRTVASSKLEIFSLIEAVNSGSYDDNYVSELLSINDFSYLISAVPFPNASTIDYLTIRAKVLSVMERSILKATRDSRINEAQARANFDSLLYNEVKDVFPMSFYEVCQSGVWDYLTGRLLLDVAVWRFGSDSVFDRFIGLNRARHVFARWWFRRSVAEESEVPPDYVLLESEWETVFERPSLCWNPAIANACLRVIQETKDQMPADYKSKYNEPPRRIWIKRIMRLTSQSDLDAFEESDLYDLFSNLHPYNEEVLP